MCFPLKRTLSLLLLFQAWSITNGEKKDFPTMDDIFDSYYEAEVQVTDLDDNSTAFAREYYSDVHPQGRLDFLVAGQETSVYFSREFGNIFEINRTACISDSVEGSIYSHYGVFYGWLRLRPFIIGPSALLWFVNDNEDGIAKTIEYKGTDSIRGIKCDWFQVKVDETDVKLTYNYYFADTSWTTPNGKNMKGVPIRIAFNGETQEYSPGSFVPLNQIVDFSYFRPFIQDLSMLSPPIGLGCVGKPLYTDLPPIPEAFLLYGEEMDLFYADQHEDVDINFNAVYFDGNRQLARYDKYQKTGTTSSLHDFNTGVTYYIEDDLTCEIKPLEDSKFENKGDDIFGESIKTTKEVLGLTGKFYYMGRRTYRGIEVDVYEKAEIKSSYLDPNNYLTVVTVFFTSEMTNAVNNAETMSDVPVYFLVTMYDTPNHVTFKKQYNVFGFDDVVGPALYNNFPLKDCFPSSQQKSYFVITMKEGQETADKIKAHHQQFIFAIKSEIMKIAGVSDLRIPFLQINYGGKQISVTGMLLDRPPALKQFHLLFTGKVTALPTMKLVDEAKTSESCAYACVDDAACRVFHFCGANVPSEGVCILNVGSSNTPIKDEDIFNKCYIYVRAEMNSSNKEEYLNKALEKFNNAVVLNEDFKIYVVLDSGGEVILTVSEVFFGDGPFDKNPTDKEYNLVIDGFQLDPASKNQFALEKEYIDTELECYRSCKMEQSMACESFSYCPTDEKKQCRLSSELFISDMPKPNRITANKNCNVYSLMYLEFYEKNEGKVLMGQGDVAFEKIKFTEECAMKCKKETDLPCRGFDFCSAQKICILHATHIADLHPSQIVDTKLKTCAHYSAKFIADYQNKGHIIIDDDSDKRNAQTVEQCARSCSEGNPSCKAFVYCGGFTTEYSICSLTKQTLESKDVKQKEDQTKRCTLYTKKPGIKDWKAEKVEVIEGITGYTKSGFTGLVVGMIIFGLIVGVVGFLGYSYYRSRRLTGGLTVKFTRQR